MHTTSKNRRMTSSEIPVQGSTSAAWVPGPSWPTIVELSCFIVCANSSLGRIFRAPALGRRRYRRSAVNVGQIAINVRKIVFQQIVRLQGEGYEIAPSIARIRYPVNIAAGGELTDPAQRCGSRHARNRDRQRRDRQLVIALLGPQQLEQQLPGNIIQLVLVIPAPQPAQLLA